MTTHTPRSPWLTTALSLALALGLGATACNNALQVGTGSKADAQRTGGVDDDGNDLCQLNSWYGDDECDDFCPQVDPDCPVSSCEPVTCEIACENGFATDEDGCEICRCAPGPTPTCEPVTCRIGCEYGFATDENGCEICECAPAPIGPGCEKVACEIACENGFARDDRGCEICQCAPPVDPTTPAPVLEQCPASASDDYTLNEATVVGDTLQLSVSYSGGCGNHVFSFCWDGTFLESLPVQVPLGVHHDANGDACEAYITSTVVVDLSRLKSTYQAGYQSKSGQIIIRIGEDGTSASYEF